MEVRKEQRQIKVNNFKMIHSRCILCNKITIGKVEHNSCIQYYLNNIFQPNEPSSSWQEWKIKYTGSNGNWDSNTHTHIYIYIYIYKPLGFLTFEDGTNRNNHYSLRSSPDESSSQF